MENILSDDPMLELQVDSSSSRSLEVAAWWAKFNSIVFIICIGIPILVMAFAINSPLWEQIEMQLDLPISLQSAIWIFLIFFIAFFGVMIGFLLSFANKTSRGLKELNQDEVESGIGALKTYFLIYAIFSILGLVISIYGLINNSYA